MQPYSVFIDPIQPLSLSLQLTLSLSVQCQTGFGLFLKFNANLFLETVTFWLAKCSISSLMTTGSGWGVSCEAADIIHYVSTRVANCWPLTQWKLRERETNTCCKRSEREQVNKSDGHRMREKKGKPVDQHCFICTGHKWKAMQSKDRGRHEHERWWGKSRHWSFPAEHTTYCSTTCIKGGFLSSWKGR